MPWCVPSPEYALPLPLPGMILLFLSMSNILAVSVVLNDCVLNDCVLDDCVLGDCELGDWALGD
jgi:hypothetical protein